MIVWMITFCFSFVITTGPIYPIVPLSCNRSAC